MFCQLAWREYSSLPPLCVHEREEVVHAAGCTDDGWVRFVVRFDRLLACTTLAMLLLLHTRQARDGCCVQTAACRRLRIHRVEQGSVSRTGWGCDFVRLPFKSVTVGAS